MKRFLFPVFLVVSLLFAGQAVAAPWYQPDGLVADDTYQLTFVTNGVMSPHMTNIEDYNTFVNNQAALNPDLAAFNWTAIASTSLINAKDNAVIQGPVYNTNKIRIADDAADMWDGSLQNSIFYNQFGVGENPNQGVWTGSNWDGMSLGLYYSLGQGYPYYGGLDKNNYQWITWGPWGSGAFSAFDSHFYAVSDIITVPSAVPAPAAIWLLGTGLLGLARLKRKK